MSTSEMGGESTGGESGREPAVPAGEPAPRRRWLGVLKRVGRVVEPFAGAAVQAAVSAWAPDWSDATEAVTQAVEVALRLRRGRGGRPRG
ncbi:hypothetical protein Slala03_76800 [Streptomyces lavendulae subsp. lavendulae]|uniref:hypothetical protein n=1 Tax=Streptomyces lavendulae TaxID=1914 RepID=UPI0024A56CC0|nr:hypothetical protein [Streptomyces lavendulae]GLV87991.1 hypothetical protein Slala03_76800 [Streptomyces lavendulae subsp. lavendulae]